MLHPLRHSLKNAIRSAEEDLVTGPTEYPMDSSVPFFEQVIRRVKDNRALATVLLILTAIIGLGSVARSAGWIGAFVEDHSAPPDPRIFRFGDQTIELAGGIGTSVEQAVVIKGALTVEAGVASEKYWIDQFYPNFKWIKHSLYSPNNDRSALYDVIEIETELGHRKKLYFDVTAFFGGPFIGKF
ncbi:MAG: hypothetical protein GY711_22865 [bacterium]|nr:hypothetical protein [bacterium]